MGAMIIFNGVGINYITDSLSVKQTPTHRISPIIGQDGSDTSYVSRDATVITCKSLCLSDEISTDGTGYRINEYRNLADEYSKTTGTLTMDSVTGKVTNDKGVDGDYFITGFDYTEDTLGNFTIDWEFTKQTKFNVTQKTFRVWNKAQALKKATTTKNNPLSSNSKKLLKDCPVLKQGGGTNLTCVIFLQRFLQTQGYYTKHKVTGVFDANTKKAVKDLQKKYKLKVTGDWDLQTIQYFQKKYKYPTDISKDIKKASKKTTSIGSAIKNKKKAK